MPWEERRERQAPKHRPDTGRDPVLDRLHWAIGLLMELAEGENAAAAARDFADNFITTVGGPQSWADSHVPVVFVGAGNLLSTESRWDALLNILPVCAEVFGKSARESELSNSSNFSTLARHLFHAGFHNELSAAFSVFVDHCYESLTGKEFAWAIRGQLFSYINYEVFHAGCRRAIQLLEGENEVLSPESVSIRLSYAFSHLWFDGEESRAQVKRCSEYIDSCDLGEDSMELRFQREMLEAFLSSNLQRRLEDALLKVEGKNLPLGAAQLRANGWFSLRRFGTLEEQEDHCRRAIRDNTAIGNSQVAELAARHLFSVLLKLGRVKEARQLEENEASSDPLCFFPPDFNDPILEDIKLLPTKVVYALGKSAESLGAEGNKNTAEALSEGLPSLTMSEMEWRIWYAETRRGDLLLALSEYYRRKAPYSSIAAKLLGVIMTVEEGWEHPLFKAEAFRQTVLHARPELMELCTYWHQLNKYVHRDREAFSQLLLEEVNKEPLGGKDALDPYSLVRLMQSLPLGQTIYLGLRVLMNHPGETSEKIQKEMDLWSSCAGSALRDYTSTAELIRINLGKPSFRNELEYLSVLRGFAGDYLGADILTVFERALRLLEAETAYSSLSAHHAEISPAIPVRHFLPFYGLLNGNRQLLEWFSNMYVQMSHTPEGRAFDRNERAWILRELEQSVIRASLIPEKSREALQNELVEILYREERNDGEERHDQAFSMKILTAAEAIDVAGLWAGEPYTSLLHKQLSPWPETIETDTEYLAQETGFAREDIRDYLSCSTTHWVRKKGDPQEIKRLREWEMEGQYQLSDLMHLARIAPEHYDSLSEKWIGILPALRFLQSLNQRYTRNTGAAMRLLGEAMIRTDPPEYREWTRWRYDTSGKIVSEQLKRLTSAQLPAWIDDHFDVLPGFPELDECLGIETGKQLLWLTGNPQILLYSGKIPYGSAACTAFDRPSYYATNLLSYIVDAHIKVCVTFDLERIFDLIPTSREIFESRGAQALVQECFPRDPFAFFRACTSRTIIKLLEDKETSEPVAWLQPTFLLMITEKSETPSSILTPLRSLFSKFKIPLARKPAPGEATSVLSGPRSRSPLGQVENFDGQVWLAAHTDRYEVEGVRIDEEKSDRSKA